MFKIKKNQNKQMTNAINKQQIYLFLIHLRKHITYFVFLTFSIKNMNSLRTDDILGAVPRIRHMPKNLYRPQGYSYSQSNQGFNQQYSKNVSRMMDYDANYNGGKWQQSYNENMYGNFPLSQYDPNPFIKPPVKHPIPNTQRLQYNNSRGNDITKGRSVSQFNNYYDSTQQQLQNNNNNQRYFKRGENRSGGEQRRMSLDYEKSMNNKMDRGDSRGGRYDSNNHYQKQREQSQIKSNNGKLSLPKQALVINYQQLKAMNLPEITSNKSSNINTQLKKQQNNNPQRSSNNSNKNIINNVLQKKSDIDNNSKRQKQRSIFRGIGFNIITNSKYQYNLQTSTPYTSKVKQ